MSSDPVAEPADPVLPTDTRNPVEVDFSVLIDANSDLELRTQGLPTMVNVIVADVNMNASSFNGLIEFWEPSGSANLGEINSHFDLDLDANDVESYKLRAVDLYNDLVEVLAGEFGCKDAKPFTTDVSDAQVRADHYDALPNFGRVALAQVAHAVLGHVAATALITNDQDFMDHMLENTSPTSCAHIIESSQSNIQANLAATLVKALLSKGYTAEFDAVIDGDNDASDLTAIVKQVVTQDPNRARGQDNNEISPNVHQKLMFYADDIIYMSITVKYPTVKSSSKDVAVPANTIGASGEQRFDLKITLA